MKNYVEFKVKKSNRRIKKNSPPGGPKQPPRPARRPLAPPPPRPTPPLLPAWAAAAPYLPTTPTQTPRMWCVVASFLPALGFFAVGQFAVIYQKKKPNLT